MIHHKIEKVKLLLDKGANPNLGERYYRPNRVFDTNPIWMLSTIRQHPSVDILKLLIERGGRISDRDERGRNILTMCDKTLLPTLLQEVYRLVELETGEFTMEDIDKHVLRL